MLGGWKAHASLTCVFAILAAPAVQAEPWDVLMSPYDAQGQYDATNHSFVLTWQAPANAPNGTTYHVYRDGGLLGIIANATFTDANLPDLATWTYRITAQHDAVESSPATLVIANPAAINSSPPRSHMMTYGPIIWFKGPFIEYYGPGGAAGNLLNETEPCTLIGFGWGPDPPYIAHIDEDCIWEIANLPP